MSPIGANLNLCRDRGGFDLPSPARRSVVEAGRAKAVAPAAIQVFEHKVGGLGPSHLHYLSPEELTHSSKCELSICANFISHVRIVVVAADQDHPDQVSCLVTLDSTLKVPAKIVLGMAHVW
jgi:hypothetical protein